MDVLSDVCDSLRLRAELYFQADLNAPFSVRLPEEAQLIRFHCVLEGACFVTTPHTAPVRLERGDFVLVPDGQSQVLSSTSNLGLPVALEDVLQGHPLSHGTLRVGEGAPDVRLLCGYLGFDRSSTHPILALLPAVVALKADDPHCGAAIRMLADGARRMDQGISFVSHRIVEIILVQCLHAFVTTDAGARSFAAAMRDAKVKTCLQAIHAAPQDQWTIETLADHAGTSRSVLSERFKSTLGMGPISYLTLWRMTKAKELLSQGVLSMTEVAERCGYTSVPAFTRRFSAYHGIGPGTWRNTKP